MDHHVNGVITDGLRARGVDVLTAAEDGTNRLSDPSLLDRVGELGRVLVSYDRDFLVEAARRQRSGIWFSGLFHLRPLKITVGQAIAELELAAKVYEPRDMENLVQRLPL